MSATELIGDEDGRQVLAPRPCSGEHDFALSDGDDRACSECGCLDRPPVADGDRAYRWQRVSADTWVLRSGNHVARWIDRR